MKSAIRRLLGASATLLFAASASASVTIHTPANGTEVEAPFTLSATAVTCSAQPVGVMGYSFDNSADSAFVQGTSMDVSVASSSGAHTLHVKAWGTSGSVCVTDVAVNVKAGQSGSGNPPKVPASARTVSNLQTFGDWKETKDGGTAGEANGAMSLVVSPSVHGASRKFVTGFKANGGERYSLDFGDDTSATNFFYDGWVYLTSSATSVANLELDMNQVIENGWTVTFGIQCDGGSGTWDYTYNAGSPARYSDRWAHSSAKCDLQGWSKNVWHHFQAYYSRDAEGKVTYRSVWLDGKESVLNATVPSAFSLGWAPRLITNFQIDGRGTSGSNVVYLDDLTISRW